MPRGGCAISGTHQFGCGKSWETALIMYCRDSNAQGRRQYGEITESGSLKIPRNLLETSRSCDKLEWLTITLWLREAMSS